MIKLRRRKKNEMKRNIPKRLYNNRYLRYWAIMNDRNNKKIDFSLYISCSLRKKRKKKKRNVIVHRHAYWWSFIVDSLLIFFISLHYLTYTNDSTRLYIHVLVCIYIYFYAEKYEEKMNWRNKNLVLLAFSFFFIILNAFCWILKQINLVFESTVLNRRNTDRKEGKKRRRKSKPSTVHYVFVFIKYLYDWYSIRTNR